MVKLTGRTPVLVIGSNAAKSGSALLSDSWMVELYGDRVITLSCTAWIMKNWMVLQLLGVKTRLGNGMLAKRSSVVKVAVTVSFGMLSSTTPNLADVPSSV